MPTRFMNKGGVEASDCVDGLPGIDEIYSSDHRLLMGKKVVFADVNVEEEKGLVKNTGFKVKRKFGSCSDESSSIGKNSDLSDNSVEKSGDDEEVQSSYKGPLDAMEALEQVLPIRKGISRFYNGKSKSFASLADASSSSSIKDIAKPDNAYMRKRRNLLACSLAWDNKTRGPSLRGSHGGGISKRVTGSSRTTLALAVAMRNSDCDKQVGVGEHNNSNPSLTMCSNFSPWRSFSLADLHQCASVAIACSSPDELATKPA